MDLEHLESQVATVQPGRRALDSAASPLVHFLGLGRMIDPLAIHIPPWMIPIAGVDTVKAA